MAGKVIFCKKPYIGSSITKPNKVIRGLKHGKKQLKVFIVVLSEGSAQLEIFHSIFLQQWYYKENPPMIIGIAGSHEEAVELVCQITKEAVEKTGKADLKSYLAERYEMHS